MKLYYIQNIGFCGNCLRWWRKGGHGYTSNLDEAWKLSKLKAEEICRVRRGEDVAWLVADVDAVAQRHVTILPYALCVARSAEDLAKRLNTEVQR